ncbi:gustatory receptor for sugar taste 64f-like [Copidosoma floridanum]|uniref:gustatory receptor for sugar taste 64f-like n=1 Tax=Copidosoma floridanum TaxID=29053 RepID=UPI0006C99FB7|nr:gustatory receptor for sugar taste 64f-like [Copidosoma floridanum]
MTENNYAFWKGLTAYIIVLYCTFSWNFMDLFLILVSVALVDQFKQLNHRLQAVKGKGMSEWWWTTARADYNCLTDIIEQIDSKISSVVLLSFSVNLYFICIQLLHSFTLKSTPLHTIYFTFSFGFLILRASMVSLFAAKIHEESNLPSSVVLQESQIYLIIAKHGKTVLYSNALTMYC